MKHINDLILAVEIAEAKLLDALADAYPIGCKVIYRLRDGVPEQEGEIVGHIGGRDAEMRVKLALSRGSKTVGHSHRYVTTLQARKIIRRCDDIHGEQPK